MRLLGNRDTFSARKSRMRRRGIGIGQGLRLCKKGGGTGGTGGRRGRRLWCGRDRKDELSIGLKETAVRAVTERTNGAAGLRLEPTTVKSQIHTSSCQRGRSGRHRLCTGRKRMRRMYEEGKRTSGMGRKSVSWPS